MQGVEWGFLSLFIIEIVLKIYAFGFYMFIRNEDFIKRNSTKSKLKVQKVRKKYSRCFMIKTMAPYS